MRNKSVFKSQLEKTWLLAKFFFSDPVQEKTMKFKKVEVLGADLKERGAFSCNDLEITNELLRSALKRSEFHQSLRYAISMRNSVFRLHQTCSSRALE